MWDREPISAAKVDRESLEKKSVSRQILEVEKSRAYFDFQYLKEILWKTNDLASILFQLFWS